MDDSKIIDLYLARDESAISLTAEKYGTRLRAIANRILHDPGRSEECENDTYLAAWNSIPPNEPRTYLFSYLGRIIRHLAIDAYRKDAARKRAVLFVELTDEMSECLTDGVQAEDRLNEEELRQTINAFLSTLPELRRNVFIRRYWFFDPVSEIGTRYGLSESNVKVMLHRTREKLRKHLKKEGYMI
ncbi:MAG: RNA polymerase sigma factor [Lachnospiraceae bacterium]|nr:RNA polymerase sigma factor [Lachnospiraceae bacterium]